MTDEPTAPAPPESLPPAVSAQEGLDRLAHYLRENGFQELAAKPREVLRLRIFLLEEARKASCSFCREDRFSTPSPLGDGHPCGPQMYRCNATEVREELTFLKPLLPVREVILAAALAEAGGHDSALQARRALAQQALRAMNWLEKNHHLKLEPGIGNQGELYWYFWDDDKHDRLAEGDSPLAAIEAMMRRCGDLPEGTEDTGG